MVTNFVILFTVYQTKRVVSKPLKEGWLVHFTNKESKRRRDYWRLDSKCLTLWKVRDGGRQDRRVTQECCRPRQGTISIKKSH